MRLLSLSPLLLLLLLGVVVVVSVGGVALRVELQRGDTHDALHDAVRQAQQQLLGTQQQGLYGEQPLLLVQWEDDFQDEEDAYDDDDDDDDDAYDDDAYDDDDAEEEDEEEAEAQWEDREEEREAAAAVSALTEAVVDQALVPVPHTGTGEVPPGEVHLRDFGNVRVCVCVCVCVCLLFLWAWSAVL